MHADERAWEKDEGIIFNVDLRNGDWFGIPWRRKLKEMSLKECPIQAAR